MLASVLVETLLSGLIAPVMMIFQSTAVGAILLGRDAGWQVQRRDDGVLPRSELMRRYTLPTLFGIAMTVIAYAVSLPLLFWMAPVIVGLSALHSDRAAVVSDLSSIHIADHPRADGAADVLLRANELAANASGQVVGPALIELRDDRELRATIWRLYPTKSAAIAARSIHISPLRAQRSRTPRISTRRSAT